MKIQVIGMGCTKCRKLAANVEQAAAELGVVVEIEKVTDLARILEYEVAMTSALAIEGVVKTAGKIPGVEELKGLLLAGRPAGTPSP